MGLRDACGGSYGFADGNSLVIYGGRQWQEAAWRIQNVDT
jgi:hypothetical protein